MPFPEQQFLSGHHPEQKQRKDVNSLSHPEFSSEANEVVNLEFKELGLLVAEFKKLKEQREKIEEQAHKTGDYTQFNEINQNILESTKKIINLGEEMEQLVKKGQLELIPEKYFTGFIKKIEKTGQKVTQLDQRENYELINNQLNGQVKIDETWYPVINDKIINKIEVDGVEKDIQDCNDICNVNNQLNGGIWVYENGKLVTYNVVLGKVVK